MLTRAVSSTDTAVNTPSRRARTRGRTVRNDVAQATVTRVSPKESPNVTALRSDTGPSHEPPDPTSTPTCTRPLPSSTDPITYATRSTGRAPSQKPRTRSMRRR